ncbi:ATP synthase F1 subunit gamma [Elusimicrobiota bacterium]
MASLREIRRKIKSVKSTQQITKAMKMVAAARMRKAQAAILSSRPFAVKLERTVRKLAALELAAGAGEGRDFESTHPYFRKPPESGRVALILVTADKGLCGSFNTNVLRAGVQWLRARSDKRIAVSAVGRKGRDLVHRLADADLEHLSDVVGIFPKANFAHAELIAKPILERFEEGGFDSVTVIFNEFRSAVSQRVVELPLLPIPRPEAVEESEGDDEAGHPFGFRYEPGREALLEALLPRYIKAQLFRVLLESQSAELAARMNAMDAATKNAGEMIDALTLGLNRQRQTIITGEIMEIVGGAEALAA